MRFPRLKICLLLALLAFGQPLSARAGVEQISEADFRALAAELAPKVNLFKAAWERDPAAEFYGGTTRDFLYWLKGQFREAHNPREAAATVARLRALKSIDVRQFIIGESDVDIVSQASTGLEAERFGVRKIDTVSPDLFDPRTPAGQNEILQGHVPAEKIRLGRDGLHANPAFGDGAGEIYRGVLSVHFASPADFAKSKYAQEGLNHPILLALRYLRLQAVNYFQSYGTGYPDAHRLHAGMDPASEKAVRAVMEEAQRPGVLAPFLAQDKFRSWLNGSLQKAYRSYSNPTAANELMKEYGVPHLQKVYGHLVEPTNQYLFAKVPEDPAAVAGRLKALGVTPNEIYLPTSRAFPDGFLYHGTRTEEAFRSILFQGILPSADGSGGAGLYGVSQDHQDFAERWGGARERVVRIGVKPDAKIVDLTSGPGAEVFARLKKKIPDGEHLYDEVARELGTDILLYPYPTPAFVVKNGGALTKAEGVHRKIMTLGEIEELVRKGMSLVDTLELLKINRLTTDEATFLREVPITHRDALEIMRRGGLTEYPPLVGWVLARPELVNDPEVYRELEHALKKALEGFYTGKKGSRGRPDRELSESILRQALAAPEMQKHPRLWKALIEDTPEYIVERLIPTVFSQPPYVNDLDALHWFMRKEGDKCFDICREIAIHWIHSPQWKIDYPTILALDKTPGGHNGIDLNGIMIPIFQRPDAHPLRDMIKTWVRSRSSDAVKMLSESVLWKDDLELWQTMWRAQASAGVIDTINLELPKRPGDMNFVNAMFESIEAAEYDWMKDSTRPRLLAALTGPEWPDQEERILHALRKARPNPTHFHEPMLEVLAHPRYAGRNELLEAYLRTDKIPGPEFERVILKNEAWKKALAYPAAVARYRKDSGFPLVPALGFKCQALYKQIRGQ